jgi:hypothetical protein
MFGTVRVIITNEKVKNKVVDRFGNMLYFIKANILFIINLICVHQNCLYYSRITTAHLLLCICVFR